MPARLHAPGAFCARPFLLFSPALLLAAHAACAAPGQAAEAGEPSLPEVAVTADDPSGYKTSRSSSATRTDTPIRQIPQSVTVISQQVLEDTGGGNVEAVMDLGGIDRGNNFAGSLASFSMRGFASSEYYRNGMPQGVHYGAMPDAANVESLDVVRGPASLTFGQGDPGGTFNIVSKKPQPHAAWGGSLTLDSHGGRRATADMTGPLNASRTLLYRLNLALDDSRTFRDWVHINRELLAPSFSLQIAPATRLMLDVEHQRQRTPLDRGIPMFPRLLHGLPDVSFFAGEPHARRMANTHTIAQLRLEHELTPAWLLEAGLQRTVGGVRGESVEASALLADRRSVSRLYLQRENVWDSKVAQLFLRGKTRWADMEHQLLLGLEYLQGYSGIYIRRSNATRHPYTLDVYAPVYGAPLPPATAASYRGGGQSTHAFIVQDQIRLAPRLHALIGLRADRHEQTTPAWMNASAAAQRTSAYTPKLGLSYDLTRNATAYISYSRSFKPNSGQDIDGNAFAPERGTAWEAGIKADLFGQKAQITASVFHITKQNVLTPHPLDADYRIAAGQVRSRGADMSFSGRISARTRAVAHVALLRAEVSKDNVLTPGAPLANVPRRHIALMLVHELGGPLQGLELGVSARHDSARWNNATARAIRMAPYSVADLMAHWRISRHLTFKATLKNAFNRRYIDRSFNSNGYPGAPRSLQAALHFMM